MQNTSDDELVRAILKGDESAGEQLINRYNRYIYGVIRHKVYGHTQNAEDLTQEVWLKVFRSLKKRYTPKGKFKEWLNTIINSVYIDWIRREGRIQLATADDEEAGATFAEIRDTAFLPPIETLMQEEVSELLQKTLDAMPDSDNKRAFLMRDMQDYSLAEIAEILDITEKAAKMKAFRGRQQFRETFCRNTNDYF